MKSILIRLGLLAMIIFILAGCSGSDGTPGANGANGTNAGAYLVNVGSNSVSPTAEAIANWKALAPQVTVTGVSIASPTVVTFTVKDTAGNGVVGLGNKSQSSSATVAGLTNIAFTLAKLVPVTGGPSKWVSYNVVRPPTVTEATGTMPATSSCNTAKTWCGTYPATDNQGTLVDNGDGSYQYTFLRDPKQAAAIVASLQATSDGLTLSNNADLGDVSFNATLTHRLGIQIGGAAPGTGSNTPNAVNLGNGVNMVNTANVVYDFRPDGGTISTRDIVKIDSCSDCHKGKVLAHGSRRDPKFCVTCHTDQIKYSFSKEATISGLAMTGSTDVIDGRAVGNFPNLIHKVHMGSELLKTGYNFVNQLKFNDIKFPQDQRNCTKCHDGAASDVKKITANGDNWKSVPSRLACGACHDGINFDTGGGTSLVTRIPDAFVHTGAQLPILDSACSICHDATKIPGYHVPVTPPNLASALHVLNGNSNTNSAWVASNTNNLPAGAIKVTYDIKSVSRNASKRPVMVFRMLQNGLPVAFQDPATTTEIWDKFMGAPSVYFVYAVAQDGIATPSDFNGSASAYLRDLWNCNGASCVIPAMSKGTLSAPDSNGYYTATLTTVVVPDGAVMLTGGLGYTYSLLTTMPLTQINLTDPNTGYPATASALATCSAKDTPVGCLPAVCTGGLSSTPYTGCIPVAMPNMTGGLIVVTPDAQKVASAGVATGGTGGAYSGRRAIVEDARCNKCHQELGVFTAETFHGAQRNDGSTCAWCHNPNRTSSGWGADSTNFIHGIHAGLGTTGVSSSGKNKRTVPFTWHAASTTEGFWTIGYPGVLKNCESCHLPGTYDFSASASASALPNKQFRTVATGYFNNSTTTLTTGCTVSATNTCMPTALAVFSLSPYVTADNATKYGSGFSIAGATGVATQAGGATLVDSPITTVCFACHDTSLATTHMKLNGGVIYQSRNLTAAGGTYSGTLVNNEQCMLCHGTGRVADIKAMHDK